MLNLQKNLILMKKRSKILSRFQKNQFHLKHQLVIVKMPLLKILLKMKMNFLLQIPLQVMILKERVREVLKTLTPREEKVIKMRFGIDVASEHTLEEVGKDFSVTRERIRQIEVKALSKLRHPSTKQKIQSFFEKEFDMMPGDSVE